MITVNEVEKLAKELLVKEVLFKSDVESLIGKRPFEEKKILDVVVEDKHTLKDSDVPSSTDDHSNEPPQAES